MTHDTIPAPPPTEPQSEPPPPAQRVPSLASWPEERVTSPGCPHPQHGPAPAHVTFHVGDDDDGEP